MIELLASLLGPLAGLLRPGQRRRAAFFEEVLRPMQVDLEAIHKDYVAGFRAIRSAYEEIDFERNISASMPLDIGGKGFGDRSAKAVQAKFSALHAAITKLRENRSAAREFMITATRTLPTFAKRKEEKAYLDSVRAYFPRAELLVDPTAPRFERSVEAVSQNPTLLTDFQALGDAAESFERIFFECLLLEAAEVNMELTNPLVLTEDLIANKVKRWRRVSAAYSTLMATVATKVM